MAEAVYDLHGGPADRAAGEDVSEHVVAEQGMNRQLSIISSVLPALLACGLPLPRHHTFVIQQSSFVNRRPQVVWTFPSIYTRRDGD